MAKVTYHGSKRQQEREEKVWTPSEIVQGKNLRPAPFVLATRTIIVMVDSQGNPVLPAKDQDSTKEEE